MLPFRPELWRYTGKASGARARVLRRRWARIDVGHVIGKEPWEHMIWVEREYRNWRIAERGLEWTAWLRQLLAFSLIYTSSKD